MNNISRNTILLILALNFVACGAKNKANDSDSAALSKKISLPAKEITVSDTGTQLVVAMTPKPTDGPVLVQVITPDEVVETIINVDPANPEAQPEVIVEVLVPVMLPVYENIVQIDEIDPATEVEAIAVTFEPTVEAVTEKVLKRIKQLEHLIRVHSKHANGNKEKLQKWIEELAELESLL